MVAQQNAAHSSAMERNALNLEAWVTPDFEQLPVLQTQDKTKFNSPNEDDPAGDGPS
jgi:hypothetical protein